MNNRRSLGDALTPEKVAFIRGDKTPPTTTPALKKQTREPETTIELDMPSTESIDPGEKQRRRRGRGRTARQHEPQASEILDQMLVPVTIRLTHRTAQALKRAALEQKLKHLKPDQVQEIGEDAFTDWLTKSGYLD
jgi:hypothetical protein